MAKVKEVWLPIPKTFGYYEISNLGNVRSYLKKGCKGGVKGNSTPIKITSGRDGYASCCIKFSELGKYTTIKIHRIVALLFLPNPKNLPFVLHKDDNKMNASVFNLEWGDQTKNIRDAFIRKRILHAKGEQSRKSKLTEMDVKSIFALKGVVTCIELGKKYNVNHTCISDIWTGRSWNHITGLVCTRKKKPKFSTDIKFK